MADQVLILNEFNDKGCPTGDTKMVTVTTEQITEIVEQATQIVALNNAGNPLGVNASLLRLCETIKECGLTNDKPALDKPRF